MADWKNLTAKQRKEEMARRMANRHKLMPPTVVFNDATSHNPTSKQPKCFRAKWLECDFGEEVADVTYHGDSVTITFKK